MKHVRSHAYGLLSAALPFSVSASAHLAAGTDNLLLTSTTHGRCTTTANNLDADFFSDLGKSGALLAASRWLSLCGYAQTTRGPARVFLRDRVPAATFDRRVQGAFLEPLGRAVYTQKIDYPSRFATCDARSPELQR